MIDNWDKEYYTSNEGGPRPVNVKCSEVNICSLKQTKDISHIGSLCSKETNEVSMLPVNW